MNGKLLLCVLVSAAACSSGRHAERVPLVPPLPIEQPQVELQMDQGSRTDADRSPPGPPASELPAPAGETRSAESQSVESQSSGPIYRSVEHDEMPPPAETTRSVEPQQVAAGGETNNQPQQNAARPRVSYEIGFGHYPNHGHYPSHGHYPNHGYYPVHTMIGASVGAAIGAHHGDPHRGAMIGGTVGFFLDLGHLWHR